MSVIMNFKQAKEAELNPYSYSGFFLDGSGNIFVLDELPNDEEWYKDANLIYAIHWEGNILYSEQGAEIEPAYED